MSKLLVLGVFVGAALGLLVGGPQDVLKPRAEEDVVPQNHCRRAAGKEILGQQIGLRETIGRGLGDIGEGQPRDLANARQHQRRQRIVDHRLVIDRQELLRDAHRDRIKPRAGTACQNDPLTHHIAPNSVKTSSNPDLQSGLCRPNTARSLQSSRELSGRFAGVG